MRHGEASIAGKPNVSHGSSEKLNDVFPSSLRPEGQEYTGKYIAATIIAPGETICQSRIWQLRKSKKDNSAFRHPWALAGFFGAPVGYSFANTTSGRVDRQLIMLKAEQTRPNEIARGEDARLRAMRAGELAPHRRLVLELLNVVYREEQVERAQASGA
ncbi:MAG: XRE family transcriptional regulator [Kutzneria sp.]|nr:XRE family transcriptional regulator [Kutzneria sp.]MBV9847230.1 XRE family transcriptional regulator [Kutzneria sp.]